MIHVTLRGGLGNQMFQYAAVRAVAESRSLEFTWAVERPPIGRRERCQRLLRLATRRHIRTDLPGAFDLKALGVPSPATPICDFKYVYEGLRLEGPKGVWPEIYDFNFMNLRDETKVQAWLQSPAYFDKKRESVHQWFAPRRRWIRAADRVMQRCDRSESRRCCIHVRRGDYLKADGGFGRQATGWALPAEYYRSAFSHPACQDVQEAIVVSDDPAWAMENLPWPGHWQIIQGNSRADVGDLLLFGRCRVNILANSTFSWWGAYLNQQPGRVVIGPKHFIGWHVGNWNPDGIAVDDWEWIDVVDRR